MSVQNGDYNTGFFHNSVHSHNHFNSISHISDSNGSTFTKWEDVVTIFTSSYNNLWSISGGLSFLDTVNALPNG